MTENDTYFIRIINGQEGTNDTLKYLVQDGN